MEPRPLLAAMLLLAATFVPWALSIRQGPPAHGCGDLMRVVQPDALGLRGELAVAVCGSEACAECRAPRGAAGLLLGRLIDIDTAPASEIEALPGVGPGVARRIVAARERGGPF